MMLLRPSYSPADIADLGSYLARMSEIASSNSRKARTAEDRHFNNGASHAYRKIAEMIEAITRGAAA